MASENDRQRKVFVLCLLIPVRKPKPSIGFILPIMHFCLKLEIRDGFPEDTVKVALKILDKKVMPCRVTQ